MSGRIIMAKVMAKVPHAAAKVHPKGGKTVHLCNWAMPGITAKGPVAMVETARRCKGAPKGGKTVHLCNWAYGLTGS